MVVCDGCDGQVRERAGHTCVVVFDKGFFFSEGLRVRLLLFNPGCFRLRRVDSVQQALVSFTGIQMPEQIVMYQGARLDPAKALQAYHLPKVRAQKKQQESWSWGLEPLWPLRPSA